MKALTRGLAAAGLMALTVLAAAGGEKTRRVEIGLTGTFMLGGRFDSGDMGGYLGLGFRSDLNLARSFMISPEVTYIFNYRSLLPACTFNLILGQEERIFVGLGPMATWATNDGHGVMGLKAHIGYKAGFTLIAASYIRTFASHSSDGSSGLLGLTVGFMF